MVSEVSAEKLQNLSRGEIKNVSLRVATGTDLIVATELRVLAKLQGC
jgi:hypothetical protein